MKTAKYLLLLLFPLLLIACGTKESESRYKAEVYEVNNGWGYLIYADGKKYINQDNIPAIQKNIPFADQQDATKCANFVIEKLETEIGSLPTITKEELKELGIKY